MLVRKPLMPENLNVVSSLPWRLNVAMVIVNQANCAWMGRRSGLPDYAWQFPQGGIHEGETSEAAMWRELEEEVGIIDADILAVHPTELRYAFPHDTAIQHGYKGQEQTWFLLRYQGDDSNIRINHEFSQWAWVPCKDLHTITKTVVVPFKRDVYTTVLNGPFQKFMLP